MERWAILYADGSVFRSENGAPHEAPRIGVQRVFFIDDQVGVGVEESHIGRWGWKTDRNDENGRWFGFDDHQGYNDYLASYPRPVVPLFGRTLHPLEWEEVLRQDAERILSETKSAWRERERRPAP